MYCDSLKKKNLLDFCENLLENLLKSPKKSKSKSAMTPVLYRFPNLLAEEKARCWVKNETRLKIPWMQWSFKHEFAHHILSFVNTIGPKNNIQARKINS